MVKIDGQRPVVGAVGNFCSTETHRIVPFLFKLPDLASPVELTLKHGVTFWTPPHDVDETDAYLRWLVLHEKLVADCRLTARENDHGEDYNAYCPDLPAQ